MIIKTAWLLDYITEPILLRLIILTYYKIRAYLRKTLR